MSAGSDRTATPGAAPDDRARREPASAGPAAAVGTVEDPAAGAAASRHPASKGPGSRQRTSTQPASEQPASGQPASEQRASKQPASGGTASTAPAFKDHFSAVADAYAAARPGYPDVLFEALAAVVPATATVWEPGCGSGQATCGLAARFARIHASDPSARQVALHWAADVTARPAHVTVSVERGEHAALADASVQLVAVAQALHWFDRGRFFAECERVLAPGGVLAAWGYGDFLAPEGMVDAVADFRALIERHWPPERAQVDGHYAGYDWPFPALPAPQLWLEADWSLAQFLGYLGSLSASARCLAQTSEDPVARHARALGAAWGPPGEIRRVRWPLFVHLRRKP